MIAHLQSIAILSVMFFASIIWVYIAARMVGRAVLRTYMDMKQATNNTRR